MNMQLEAGRALDALVAEKVFGWERSGGLLGPPLGDPRRVWAAEWDENGLPHWLPNYSTDLNTAYAILDKYPNSMWAGLDGRYVCSIVIGEGRGVEGVGETPELAICRAALLVAAK